MSRSENNWEPAWVGEDRLNWVDIPGCDVRIQTQKGQPTALLRAWIADHNAFIEPVRDRDTASYTPTNSVSTSNHLNGTAADINWDSHPFHVRGTFTPEQMKTLREMLDFYEDTIFWAGDWNDPIDEMHVQLGYDTFNNPHTADFIRRKIRPDGFSTFRRGGQAAAPPVQSGVAVLAEVMGNSVPSRYPVLYPAVAQCLRDCGCTTVNRIAMWCAQIGHESAGLRYMEEIADGSAYEGRSDLGNTVPGDGPRFKGRGPIQVTGRHNYTVLSEWAFSKGLVPSPTFFVDQPAQLASDKYGFIGVTWYWTTQRRLNEASDNCDVVAATHMINGGEHGLSDRQHRYTQAIGMGDRLLQLLSAEEDDELADPQIAQMVRDIHAELFTPRPSQSIYATPGEGAKYRPFDLLSSVDAMRHEEDTETTAKRGNLPALDTIVNVANGHGARTDPYAVGRARRFIQELEREHPEVLRGYIEAKSRATGQ